jgi:hypothetical protein
LGGGDLDFLDFVALVRAIGLDLKRSCRPHPPRK